MSFAYILPLTSVDIQFCPRHGKSTPTKGTIVSAFDLRAPVFLFRLVCWKRSWRPTPEQTCQVGIHQFAFGDLRCLTKNAPPVCVEMAFPLAQREKRYAVDKNKYANFYSQLSTYFNTFGVLGYAGHKALMIPMPFTLYPKRMNNSMEIGAISAHSPDKRFGSHPCLLLFRRFLLMTFTFARRLLWAEHVCCMAIWAALEHDKCKFGNK